MEREDPGIAFIKAVHGGDVVGVGFLVTERLVMTCAHNVIAALGLPDALSYAGYPAPPSLHQNGGGLCVNFPFCDAEQDFKVDKIAEWHAPVSPQKRTKKLADVAVLALDDTPRDVRPIEFAREENYQGHRCWAYGVPRGVTLGTWACGTFVRPVAGGLYEILKVDAAGEQRDWFIEEGFSGAVAWSEELGTMVGMIVEVLGKSRAYMIPAERLKLVRAAARCAGISSEDESIDLTCCIDRDGPLQHLKTMPWQPARRLLTLVIDGDRQQVPYVFVGRIKREGQLAPFFRGEAPEFVSIAWPGETHLTDPREQLKLLVRIAADTVEAKGQK